jgi:hypothetical protein
MNPKLFSKFASFFTAAMMVAFAVTPLSSQGAGVSQKQTQPPVSELKSENFPWQAPDFEDCGQACLYHKANENVSLQAVYVLRKIAILQDNPQKARENLPGFCKEFEQDESCVKRYLRVQIPRLRRMRTALVLNSDSAAKLKSPRQKAVFEQGDRTDGKLPQVPYVSSYEDLKKEHAKMRGLISEEFRRFADSVSRPPARDEFIQFREIDRDPEDPRSGKMVVAVTGPDGRHAIDERAYLAALKDYEQHAQTAIDDRKALLENLPEVAKLDRLPGAPRSLDARTADESRQAFTEARGTIIDTANRVLKRSGVVADTKPSAELSFNGPKVARSPANKQKYTGKEKVHAVKRLKEGRRDFYTVVLAPEDLEAEVHRLEGERY